MPLVSTASRPFRYLQGRPSRIDSRRLERTTTIARRPMDARRDNSSMSRKEPEEGPVHPSRTNLHNPLSPGFFRYPRPSDDLVFRVLNVKLLSWAFGGFCDLVERFHGALFEAGPHKFLRKNRNFRKLNIP